MKHIIGKATVIAVIVGLTACSTNTQRENTILGAGTGAVAGGLLGSLATGAGSGWVIAGGAVAGALIGGVIGHNMDSSDSANINSAMEKKTHHATHWTNSDYRYRIVPTSGLYTYKGNHYCRNYVMYAEYKGKHSKSTGITCRMKDGMWHQVK